MARPAADAARNNADWCALVCAAHGLSTHADALAWSSPRRTPALLPDAVTLSPDVTADTLLARIDLGPGASVKDSFATLDLTEAGFRVLFEAQWIEHRGPTPVAPGWRVVDDPVRWERAWSGADAVTGALTPEVLSHPAVTALANADLTAGALLNVDERGHVGITNLFFGDGDRDGAWAGATALARERHPGAVLLGYESGAELAAARAVGFTSTGPLRVWIREMIRP